VLEEVLVGLTALRCCAPWSQSRRRVCQAASQLAIEHQAAADEGIDKHMHKTFRAAPAPSHQFGHASGCGVFDELHGNLGEQRELGLQIKVLSSRSALSAHAQDRLPAAYGERGDADACDALHFLFTQHGRFMGGETEAPAHVVQRGLPAKNRVTC
jgi:hypothetical protein